MFIRVPQFDFDIDAFENPLIPSLRLQSNTIKLDLKLGCFFWRYCQEQTANTIAFGDNSFK